MSTGRDLHSEFLTGELDHVNSEINRLNVFRTNLQCLLRDSRFKIKKELKRIAFSIRKVPEQLKTSSGTTVTQSNFDLVRLTKSKKEVDLSPNTVRAYARDGLALYRKGRAVFFSRSELERFIKSET